ncbi:MAG: hypothetical protein GVY16_06160 [Planctomycetes bacterium]|nr:hypothetical protein [Phycisphaerae bacterium]NBB95307.1 hypothetical protein [Planctomycetota bacterium]
MKRAILSVLIACLLTTLPLGCGRKRKEDNPGSEPRYLLELKWPAGTYDVDADVTLDQKIDADQMDANIVFTMNMDGEMQANPADEANHRKLAVMITSMKGKFAGMPMVGDLSFDTTRPAPKQAPQPGMSERPAAMMHRMMSDVCTKPFTITVDADWNVISRGGMENLSPMLQENPAFDRLGEQTWLDVAQLLPDHPVGKGAVWHNMIRRDVPPGGMVEIDAECELTDIRDTSHGKVAVIAYTGYIDDASMQTPDANIDSMDMEIRGELHFTIDGGYPLSDHSSFTADIDASSQGRDMEIELKGEATTVMTRQASASGPERPTEAEDEMPAAAESDDE